MNKIILIGNLTKKPELATTNNGKSVCKFSIATSRRFSGANGEKITDFHNIVVWGKPAESCAKYLDKGKKCAIIGELQNRSYDANDGTKRYISEVIADEVEFLTPIDKKEESVNNKEELQPIDDDSLPF